MAGEWRQTTWGDEISLEYGKRLRDYANGTGPIRVFGTNGAVGWTDKSLAPGPGIIVGRKGAYRGVHYSPKPFFVIDTAYYVRPKTELDMRWLYYAIIHYRLGNIDDGSPIPSTTRASVYVRDLAVPPLTEQKAIADILGTLDDKIELNHRMNRTLEAMARAIFKAWFVDFEPIKAKAAGSKSFRGMPQDVFDRLPDRFTETELGSVPEGWETGSLADLVKERKERVMPSPETRQLPYVPIDCITSESIWLTTSKSGNEAKSSLVLFEENDILFGAMRPYFHKVCLAPFSGTTRTTAFVLQPIVESDVSFALLLLSEKSTIDFATQHSVGSTIPYAKWKGYLEAMPVVMPPKTVRNEMHAIVWPMIEQMKKAYFENRALSEVREALLPKLVSGELSVTELQEDANGD